VKHLENTTQEGEVEDVMLALFQESKEIGTSVLVPCNVRFKRHYRFHSPFSDAARD
jgi:hypothetical protein